MYKYLQNIFRVAFRNDRRHEIINYRARDFTKFRRCAGNGV